MISVFFFLTSEITSELRAVFVGGRRCSCTKITCPLIGDIRLCLGLCLAHPLHSETRRDRRMCCLLRLREDLVNLGLILVYWRNCEKIFIWEID